MEFKNLTPEQQEKARTCQTPEELGALQRVGLALFVREGQPGLCGDEPLLVLANERGRDTSTLLVQG